MIKKTNAWFLATALTIHTLSACSPLGEPDFTLGGTDFWLVADAFWPDLEEAHARMREVAPETVFMTDVILWPADYDLGHIEFEGELREIAAIYTHWENEIEIRMFEPDSPAHYGSFAHELAHRWTRHFGHENDSANHGPMWSKNFLILHEAASDTQYSRFCRNNQHIPACDAYYNRAQYWVERAKKYEQR